MSTLRQIAGLIGWLVLSFIAGLIGAVASIHAASFYASLARPAWAPPASVFGPVWTVLYALMGVAAWLVWRVGGYASASRALNLFLIQLSLNALWSWLFFGFHWGAVAFVDIVLLWLLITLTLVAFWRVRIAAGVLLVPYLLWVTFASVLNFATWQMNPQLLG